MIASVQERNKYDKEGQYPNRSVETRGPIRGKCQTVSSLLGNTPRPYTRTSYLYISFTAMPYSIVLIDD